MTPQERQLIEELFDRLASVESMPRDPEATAVIAEAMRRAPNAVYTLVQTVLLQDEALRRAGERIEELEQQSRAAAAPAPQGSFLDSMRDRLFGQEQAPAPRPATSVPRAGGGQSPAWNTGAVLGGAGADPRMQDPRMQDPRMQDPRMQDPRAGAPGGGTGSFLGTAASAAAGVVAGSLLMNSVRGMMGGGGAEKSQSLADASGSKSPWSTDTSSSADASKGDLAKDAGLNDVGSGNATRAGQFDNTDDGRVDQANYNDSDHDNDEGGGDYGPDDDGYDDDDDDGYDDDGDYGDDSDMI